MAGAPVRARVARTRGPGEACETVTRTRCAVTHTSVRCGMGEEEEEEEEESIAVVARVSVRVNVSACVLESPVGAFGGGMGSSGAGGHIGPCTAAGARPAAAIWGPVERNVGGCAVSFEAFTQRRSCVT